jgi:tripartite-type tricarboxylate transporter receptor subunit TctC
MLVPYAPGGNADTLGRIISQSLGQALAQQFIVENRAGAGGVIGTDVAAKAAPDGYTLLFMSSVHAVNPGVYPKLPFDPIRDFTPIGLVGSTPLILTVTSALPAKSVKDLIALARARPGELSYGSGGNGSSAHLAGALFNSMTHVNIVHVPYKATQQTIIDVSTGQVQVIYPSTTAVLQHMKAGRVRGLAITSRERSALVPELPTMREAGVPGYEATIWTGMLAPARTPASIITKVNSTIVQQMQVREVRERFAALGAEPTTSTPAAFGKFVADEIAKWGKVVKDAGVKVE